MKTKKETLNIVISFAIVIIIIALAVYSIIKKKDNDKIILDSNDLNSEIINSNIEEINNPQTNDKNMENAKVAKSGDVLVMNYTGKLEDGTVFDSNVDPKFGHVQPFEFTLGAGQVIAGWDEGLVGMKVGEKKTLNISPDKGYGSRAVGPIPANSTLIFDVELVGIK